MKLRIPGGRLSVASEDEHHRNPWGLFCKSLKISEDSFLWIPSVEQLSKCPWKIHLL